MEIILFGCNKLRYNYIQVHQEASTEKLLRLKCDGGGGGMTGCLLHCMLYHTRKHKIQ